MTQTTFIPGKDVALESTIQALQAKLQALGFYIDGRSWLNPVLSDMDDEYCSDLLAAYDKIHAFA